jgi:prevent-host-death family protein
MDYGTAIEPVTVLKTKSAELIRRARESGQPIVITQNGKATAVLQDVESFQRQREALLLLKFLAPGSQDLRAGRSIDHSKVVDRLSEKLKDLKGG